MTILMETCFEVTFHVDINSQNGKIINRQKLIDF